MKPDIPINARRAGLPRRPGLPVPHRMSIDLGDLVLAEREPAKLPWAALEVNVVLEVTAASPRPRLNVALTGRRPSVVMRGSRLLSRRLGPRIRG
jgi:hypothetical protein